MFTFDTDTRLSVLCDCRVYCIYQDKQGVRVTFVNKLPNWRCKCGSRCNTDNTPLLPKNEKEIQPGATSNLLRNCSKFVIEYLRLQTLIFPCLYSTHQPIMYIYRQTKCCIYAWKSCYLVHYNDRKWQWQQGSLSYKIWWRFCKLMTRNATWLVCCTLFHHVQ